MNNPWQRRGMFYVCRLDLYRENGRVRAGMIISQMCFFTYWALRVYHGKRKFNELTMALGEKKGYVCINPFSNAV